MKDVNTSRPQSAVWRDYLALTKPNITFLCLLMALGGMGLAPGEMDPVRVLATLVGTALSVGSANALNMYWERESDKLMKRTRARPLASGRLNARAALWFGIALGVLSVALLAGAVNLLTAILGLVALLGYVLVYTPMKRRSPHALVVGAVPGAMPPLMGWTAMTNELSAPGLVLFLVLLVWQIPHFVAISLRYKDDYAKAGIKAVPVVRGDRHAKWLSVAYSFALIPLSLMFVPLGVASWIYGAVALVLGVWFLVLSMQGLKPLSLAGNQRWARKFFLASLVYLPVLTAGLMLDLALKIFE